MSFLAGLAGVAIAYAAVIDRKDGSMTEADWAAFAFGCLLLVIATVMYLWEGDE